MKNRTEEQINVANNNSSALPMSVTLIKGKQYLLREGDVFNVDYLGEEKGLRIGGFPLLFHEENGEFSFGQPTIKGGEVELEVLEDLKSEKIDVIKFKAKSRYSKKIGHRSLLTRVRVTKIKGGRHGS